MKPAYLSFEEKPFSTEFNSTVNVGETVLFMATRHHYSRMGKGTYVGYFLYKNGHKVPKVRYIGKLFDYRNSCYVEKEKYAILPNRKIYSPKDFEGINQ